MGLAADAPANPRRSALPQAFVLCLAESSAAPATTTPTVFGRYAPCRLPPRLGCEGASVRLFPNVVSEEESETGSAPLRRTLRSSPAQARARSLDSGTGRGWRFRVQDAELGDEPTDTQQLASAGPRLEAWIFWRTSPYAPCRPTRSTAERDPPLLRVSCSRAPARLGTLVACALHGPASPRSTSDRRTSTGDRFIHSCPGAETQAGTLPATRPADVGARLRDTVPC